MGRRSSVVGAGHALVGEDDNNTALQAIAKGEPLVMFATIYQRSPYSVFSYPSKSIRTLKDFAGMKVAIPPATRPLLDPLLQKAGVSLSSVHFVPVVNISQFTSHQVDAYFGFSTNQGVAIKQKGISFITTPNWDLGLKSYGNVLITRRETLAKQRALLVRYLRATIKGWEYALAHPTQMGHLTVTKFAAPGDNLAAEIGQAVAQVALIKNPAGIMRFTYPGMQEVISAMEILLVYCRGHAARLSSRRARWLVRRRSRGVPFQYASSRRRLRAQAMYMWSRRVFASPR